MSRIGRMPIEVPAGVTVTIGEDNVITVKGPKGELTKEFPVSIKVEQEGNVIHVTRPNDAKENRAAHGMTRSILNSMVHGVVKEFEKELQVNGIGYRVQKQGKTLNMNLGFSHPVTIDEEEGITLDVPDPNKIIVKGADKQQVGQVAARIRAIRPPEPYKGKGIKYADEVIRRKEGKTGAKKK